MAKNKDEVARFAQSHGWTFVGTNGECHRKFVWSSNGVTHVVFTGGAKHMIDPRARRNAISDFKRCMRGQCVHSRCGQ